MYFKIYSLVAGIWPDSKFANSFIFAKTNEDQIDSYVLGMYYKCVEGMVEAAPQLTIQTTSMLLTLNQSKRKIK